MVATVHHPITVDREIELAAAPTRRRRAALRRWYAFTRMQGRVARRLPGAVHGVGVVAGGDAAGVPGASRSG